MRTCSDQGASRRLLVGTGWAVALATEAPNLLLVVVLPFLLLLAAVGLGVVVYKVCPGGLVIERH
jgi:hypothetical protein